MSAILQDADIAFARLLWSIYINTDLAANFALSEIGSQARRAKC